MQKPVSCPQQMGSAKWASPPAIGGSKKVLNLDSLFILFKFCSAALPLHPELIAFSLHIQCGKMAQWKQTLDRVALVKQDVNDFNVIFSKLRN